MISLIPESESSGTVSSDDSDKVGPEQERGIQIVEVVPRYKIEDEEEEEVIDDDEGEKEAPSSSNVFLESTSWAANKFKGSDDASYKRQYNIDIQSRL